MNYRPLFLIYHFLSWTGFSTQIHVCKCLLFPPLNSPGFPLFFWGSHRIPILPPSHPTDWVLTSGFPWFLGHNWHKPPILKLECSSFPTLYAFPLPGFNFFLDPNLIEHWVATTVLRSKTVLKPNRSGEKGGGCENKGNHMLQRELSGGNNKHLHTWNLGSFECLDYNLQ